MPHALTLHVGRPTPQAPVLRTLADVVWDATRYALIQALNETHGCIVDAAAHLGIHRGTLWSLLNRHHIIPAEVVPDFRPYAGKVARQWAKQVACEYCGRPMFHRGALKRHQRRCHE